jgi:hypothetical protein
MNVENRMAIRRALIPLALALFAARCSDRITPPSAAVVQPHFLRWAGSAPPQFAAIGALPGGAGGGGGGGGGALRASLVGGLSLSQYTAAFWAVRGQQRSVQINYLSATGDTSWQFLRLTTTDPAYVPGSGDLAPGDSVLITVTVDPSNIKVSLEPTGLLFGDPAQLQISYSGANGDLNGDGVVDDADKFIESQLLGMWYREGTAVAWERIQAFQSLADKTFTTTLPHFCEYAVSW